MQTFYVTIRPVSETGRHIMHRERCDLNIDSENRVYLPLATSVEEALENAKKIFPEAAACEKCCTQAPKTSVQ